MSTNFSKMKLVKTNAFQTSLACLKSFLLATVLGVSGSAIAAPAAEHYGAEFDAGKAQPLSMYLEMTASSDVKTTSAKTASSNSMMSKDIIVTAKIGKVCQSSGCWFETSGKNGEPVRVTFKDYAFTIPKDSLGKSVAMIGRLQEKEISVQKQKYFLKDAKAPQSEIDAVKDSKKMFEFEASGLTITGS